MFLHASFFHGTLNASGWIQHGRLIVRVYLASQGVALSLYVTGFLLIGGDDEIAKICTVLNGSLFLSGRTQLLSDH